MHKIAASSYSFAFDQIVYSLADLSVLNYSYKSGAFAFVNENIRQRKPFNRFEVERLFVLALPETRRN